MRWLHINHRGPMWPRVGLFVHTGKCPEYAPGVDLVLAFTRPGRVEWRETYSGLDRVIAARRRYWVRFSWNPWFKFHMVRGVTPADEKP